MINPKTDGVCSEDLSEYDYEEEDYLIDPEETFPNYGEENGRKSNIAFRW